MTMTMMQSNVDCPAGLRPICQPTSGIALTPPSHHHHHHEHRCFFNPASSHNPHSEHWILSTQPLFSATLNFKSLSKKYVAYPDDT